MEKVYHSTSIENIKEFVPKESTHGHKWVYATKDMIMSSVFLSTLGGDFTCCVGRDPESGRVYICERFEGSFNYRYENKKGSIYILPGNTFLENKTHWDEEAVSPKPIIPLTEIKITDVKDYLLTLKSKGDLIIKMYPEKIDGIPEDDEDLVHRGIVWTRKHGNVILNQIKKFHPHLLDRVVQGIEDGAYLKI